MADRLRQTVVDAQRGDRAALAKLVAEHMPPLQAFVRVRAGAMLQEQESVGDLVQSVCREALDHLSAIDYRGDAQLRSWLFLLATRKILDRNKYYRRAQRDVAKRVPLDDHATQALLRAYGPVATPSQIASAREELDRIERTVAQLPDAQRDAIAYVKLLGLGYADVARRLDVTESAVRGLVARGLATLAERLREPGADSP